VKLDLSRINVGRTAINNVSRWRGGRRHRRSTACAQERARPVIDKVACGSVYQARSSGMESLTRRRREAGPNPTSPLRLERSIDQDPRNAHVAFPTSPVFISALHRRQFQTESLRRDGFFIATRSRIAFLRIPTSTSPAEEGDRPRAPTPDRPTPLTTSVLDRIAR
jgi:hypothetical protein